MTNENYHNMGEIEVTMKYLGNLAKIFNEKGLLSVIPHEIMSTRLSLRTRTANLFETRSPAENLMEVQRRSNSAHHYQVSETVVDEARYEESRRTKRISDRIAKRNKFLLEGA